MTTQTIIFRNARVRVVGNDVVVESDAVDCFEVSRLVADALALKPNAELTGGKGVKTGGQVEGESGIITKSPDGTRWRIQVSDIGVVSAVEVF